MSYYIVEKPTIHLEAVAKDPPTDSRLADYFRDKAKTAFTPAEHGVTVIPSGDTQQNSEVLLHFGKFPTGARGLLAKCTAFKADSLDPMKDERLFATLQVQKLEPSRVIRFRLQHSTTTDEIDRVLAELRAVHFLARHGGSLLGAIGVGAPEGKPVHF